MPGNTICAAALDESEQLCSKRWIALGHAGEPGEPGQEPTSRAGLCFDDNDHNLSSETTQWMVRLHPSPAPNQS